MPHFRSADPNPSGAQEAFVFVIAPAIFISCILFFLVIVASLGALFAKNDSEAGVWLGHGRAPEGYFTLADRRYDRRIANRRTV